MTDNLFLAMNDMTLDELLFGTPAKKTVKKASVTKSPKPVKKPAKKTPVTKSPKLEVKQVLLNDFINRSGKIPKAEFNAALINMNDREFEVALQHFTEKDCDKLNATILKRMEVYYTPFVNGTFGKCNGVTKRSTKCNKDAINGTNYCSIHTVYKK